MFLSFQEWIIIGITLIACLLGYAYHLNSFFRKNKINYLKPMPIFGNMFNLAINRKHIIDKMDEVYKNFPKDKYVGFFNFTSPIVIVNDLELIKKIGIKDFDHFVDHMEFTDEELEPFFSTNLFALKGDKWREMRNTLSPAFTSSKMRGMLPFIQEIGQKVVDHLNSDIQGNSSKEYDLKDLTSRYANDVIASCAFGIQLDSLKDKDNEFFTFAKAFSQLNFLDMLKTFIFFISPRLMRILKLNLGNDKVNSFFHALFTSNMRMRENKSIVRPDMIHLLMLAKKGSLTNEKDDEDSGHVSEKKKTQWNDVELTAQALIFIFAGFDTISTTVSFLLYELAVNPDIQDRLRSEIDEFMDENKGKMDYNALNKLKYLDMVVSEALRLWAPAPIIDRMCVKSYTLPPQNEESDNSHKMNPGDLVWIPAYQIHRDPKYYKNPDKFDPERFSDENRSSINPSTYLPFGIGPRLCIGSRFALMEMKLFAIYFVYNFIVEPSAKTSVPMKIQPHFFDLKPVTGHHLGIKKRTRSS